MSGSVTITITMEIPDVKTPEERAAAVEAVTSALEPLCDREMHINVRHYGTAVSQKSETTKATTNPDPYNNHIDPGF